MILEDLSEFICYDQRVCLYHYPFEQEYKNLYVRCHSDVLDLVSGYENYEVKAIYAEGDTLNIGIKE